MAIRRHAGIRGHLALMIAGIGALCGLPDATAFAACDALELADFDEFGRALGNAGDLDGDGIAELVVGATGDADGGDDAGAVWLFFFDNALSIRKVQKISNLCGQLSGADNPGGLLDPGDFFGFSVAGIGDFDGDGTPDLGVGAIKDDDGGEIGPGGEAATGAVWILLMNPDGTVREPRKISDTEGGLSGPDNPGGLLENGGIFGSHVTSLGDLDQDGVTDLAIGAHRADAPDPVSGFNAGRIWVLLMNADATVRETQPISRTEGGVPEGVLDPGDRLGHNIAPVGDMDGDGVVDFFTGTHRDDDNGEDRGAVHLFYLNRDGTVKAGRKISDAAGRFSCSPSPCRREQPGNPGGVLRDGDLFGRSVTNIGDIDGDGIVDIAVGAPRDDDGGAGPQERGAVYVLSLIKPNGLVKYRRKISETRGGLTGPGNPGGVLDLGDLFGRSLISADFDGDGRRELVVSASLDDDGGQDRGAFYVLKLTGTGAVFAGLKVSSSGVRPLPGGAP
jgi:hypothetical protein